MELCDPSVLIYSDREKPFIVQRDDSEHSVCGFLSQRDEDGKLHSVQLASRKMDVAERRYTVCEKRALAVVFALKTFHAYLLSLENFELIQDHQALKTVIKKKDAHNCLAQ